MAPWVDATGWTMASFLHEWDNRPFQLPVDPPDEWPLRGGAIQHVPEGQPL